MWFPPQTSFDFFHRYTANEWLECKKLLTGNQPPTLPPLLVSFTVGSPLEILPPRFPIKSCSRSPDASSTHEWRLFANQTFSPFCHSYSDKLLLLCRSISKTVNLFIMRGHLKVQRIRRTRLICKQTIVAD